MQTLRAILSICTHFLHGSWAFIDIYAIVFIPLSYIQSLHSKQHPYLEKSKTFKLILTNQRIFILNVRMYWIRREGLTIKNDIRRFLRRHQSKRLVIRIMVGVAVIFIFVYVVFNDRSSSQTVKQSNRQTVKQTDNQAIRRLTGSRNSFSSTGLNILPNFFFVNSSASVSGRKNLKWTQISAQYRGNRFRNAACARCTYTNSLAEADVVFAHPHKTRIRKSHPRQIWIASFWESEAIYPPIDHLSSYDLSMSYRFDATYPNFAMITDTFDETKLLTPIPWAIKRENEMMSVWISNCRAKARNALLKSLKHEGVSVASYGRCQRNHNEKEPLTLSHLNASHAQQLLDFDQIGGAGHQKIAHSAQYLFSFAAENSISDYYHTEKIYHGLMAGSIPIYYGAETVDQYVPEHSIIKASDYESGTQLGQYLLKVAENKTLYDSYFEWRTKPLPDYFAFKLQKKYQTTCGICDDISGRLYDWLKV